MVLAEVKHSSSTPVAFLVREIQNFILEWNPSVLDIIYAQRFLVIRAKSAPWPK